MFGGGLAKGLIKQGIVIAIAAGATFVAIAALGAVLYFALCLVMVPMGAAAVTALVFALIAAITAFIVTRREDWGDEEEDSGLTHRAIGLFKERPILGTVAGLAAGWIFLRNPALATMVAAAFTERTQTSRRRRY